MRSLPIFIDETKTPTWIILLTAILFIYLFNLWIFSDNIFKGDDFLFGGDNLAAAPIAKMGEDFQKAGEIPHWCPYIFCGMPMVGSLLYANHYYFAFTSPIQEILSVLFLGSQFGWLFFHYLLAALGVFLLLRRLKVHWIFALLCGILYAYNPAMVVYADVGHGSKVMTMAYLPWILFFTWNLFKKPGPGWAAGLALFYGLILLALHVQIAYYGAMMMGLLVLFVFIAEGKACWRKNLTATLYLIGAGILAFGIASPLYLQILEYSQYSIRGGGATGGASWDYATAWSFHPLESLTYVFPSFFGFGGQSYWGFMPFTDMPLYWGGVTLLFMPFALIYKRDKLTIFLLILAAFAWMVSFGKFFPVLYKPLYALLPYFDKFRVPSLIQVLVILPMVILAGRGLQVIWERTRLSKEESAPLGNKILTVGGIIAGLCFLLLIFQTALKPIFAGWIAASRPQWQGQGATAAFELFTGDLLRLFVIVCVIYGISALVLLKKAPYLTFILAGILVVAIEIRHFDKKVLHPTPPQMMEEYLKADDVTNFLQQDTEPYRIFSLSSSRNANWYMPHHIESIQGYSGAKIRLYQELVDSVGFNNLKLLQLMNARYFISDRPINHPDFAEVFSGQREKVYRYKNEMPRAFLVNQAVQASSNAEIFRLFHRPEFDFSKTAVLEEPLKAPLDEEAEGNVTWIERKPDFLHLKVESSGNQLLFLSEVYYPSGWIATIDGIETPILKCNYLFRGIEIPAGDHDILLKFKPISAEKGKIFKWGSFLVILLGFCSIFYLKRRSASPARQETGDGV